MLSLIPVFVGFHKLSIYENPDGFYGEPKNAYVGGDAYNYIINAGLASAYFTLATFIAVIASALLIASFLKEQHATNETPSPHIDSQEPLIDEEVL